MPRRLWFQEADLPVSAAQGYALEGVSFELQPGELALVELDKRYPSVPLLDAALGLSVPSCGAVGFNDRSWSDRNAKEASQARSLIGSVLDRAEWVANLEVDQNILLRGQHHSNASESDLRQEAEHWAAHFDLGQLPAERPHQVARSILRRAACVRAMMNQPQLILLEQPTREDGPGLIEQLVAAVSLARGWGASILWTTTNPIVLRDVTVLADKALLVNGSRLIDRRKSTQ